MALTQSALCVANTVTVSNWQVVLTDLNLSVLGP